MENPVVNPATDGTSPGAQAMAQQAGAGADGAGIHGQGVFSTAANGGAGLSEDLTRNIAPGLFRDQNDENVVKEGWSQIPINAMMRDMGSRKVNSTVFKHWSVDLRVVDGAVGNSPVSVSGDKLDRTIPKPVDITVADAYIFDVTDQITFDGLPGYKVEGGVFTALPHVNLNALVVGVKDATTITVQFLNAKTGTNLTIPANTAIANLGHAAAEEDGSTTPWFSLPEPDEQYIQKFLVQSQVSAVFQQSAKEVNWTEDDVDEVIVHQLMEDIEKTYIFGVKSYTFNPATKRYTRTCSGIVEQLMLGGATIVEFYKGDIEFSDLLNGYNDTFIGNSGSNNRYGYMGCNVAPAIWGIKDVTKMVKISDFRAFNYDFSQLTLMGYNIRFYHHPLFDKMDKLGTKYRNWALILDRQYIERRVYRSMEETVLELKKTGTYDGNSRVWCEMSAPVVKYPKAHALWIFKDGKRPDSESGSPA